MKGVMLGLSAASARVLAASLLRRGAGDVFGVVVSEPRCLQPPAARLLPPLVRWARAASGRSLGALLCLSRYLLEALSS